MSESKPPGIGPAKASVLDPPTEDWDREERRATIFMLMFYDNMSAMSSGWPNCMQTDEVVSGGLLFTLLTCRRLSCLDRGRSLRRR